MRVSVRLSLYQSLFSVLCCFFNNLTCPDSGGAIYCSANPLNKINVDASMFVWCISSVSGGAIFCESGSGSFNSSSCSFLYCHAPTKASLSSSANYHYVFGLSFYLCSYSSSLCSNVNAILQYGIQNAQFINCSRTFADHQTGFLQSAASGASATKYLNNWGIRNGQLSTGFHSFINHHESYFMNFVNNSLSVGLIYLHSVSFVQCHSYIFISNTGTLTSTISSWPGTAYFINCFFDTSNPSTGNYALGLTNPIFNTHPATYTMSVVANNTCDTQSQNSCYCQSSRPIVIYRILYYSSLVTMCLRD